MGGIPRKLRLEEVVSGILNDGDGARITQAKPTQQRIQQPGNALTITRR